MRKQVEALEDRGHKRLILVFGEHPKYDAPFIADTVRAVYGTTRGKGEIRRVNINAAPLDIAGIPHRQGGRHRDLPGLPGDLPPRHLFGHSSGRLPQGRLPLAARFPGACHGSGAR